MNKLLTWYWQFRLFVAAKRRGVKGMHATLSPTAKPENLWRVYKTMHRLLTEPRDVNELRESAVGLNDESF